MTSTKVNRGEELMWHLTSKAIVGLVGIGITLAIAVGGWSLKMQMESATQLREMRASFDSSIRQAHSQNEVSAAERQRLEQRIVALEQWGPKYGPRVTTKDLDARMQEVMDTYAKLYDRLVITTERLSETLTAQTTLLARFDERLKRMEDNRQ